MAGKIGGIGQAGSNVVRLQIWKVAQNFVCGSATGQHFQNVSDPYAHPPDTGATMALRGIDSYVVQ